MKNVDEAGMILELSKCEFYHIADDCGVDVQVTFCEGEVHES